MLFRNPRHALAAISMPPGGVDHQLAALTVKWVGGEQITRRCGARIWEPGKFEWRNIPVYWICGSTFPENYVMPSWGYKMGVTPEWITKADTLEELATKLGFDWKGFEATLESFNANALEGVDPNWHRGEYDFNNGGQRLTGRPIVPRAENP